MIEKEEMNFPFSSPCPIFWYTFSCKRMWFIMNLLVPILYKITTRRHHLHQHQCSICSTWVKFFLQKIGAKKPLHFREIKWGIYNTSSLKCNGFFVQKLHALANFAKNLFDMLCFFILKNTEIFTEYHLMLNNRIEILIIIHRGLPPLSLRIIDLFLQENKLYI